MECIIEEIKDTILALLAKGKISPEEAFKINMKLEDLRASIKKIEQVEEELEEIKHVLKNFMHILQESHQGGVVLA